MQPHTHDATGLSVQSEQFIDAQILFENHASIIFELLHELRCCVLIRIFDTVYLQDKQNLFDQFGLKQSLNHRP